MSLLAPLFLLGMATIALPVWLHRMNTRSPERRRFSSSMLLEQSTQQTYIKKQLQYLLLLAARILFLVLLVLAFTKPQISKPPVSIGGEGSVLHMIVMDTSFSMNYGDTFERARTEAGRIIDNMDSGDIVQLIAAGNGLETVTAPTGIRDDITGALDRLSPGNARLDMGTMIASLDQLIEDYGNSVRLHLVSDFQESGLPAKFTDLVPDSLKSNLSGMELHPVAGEAIDNIYVTAVDKVDNNLHVVARGNLDSGEVIPLTVSLNGILYAEHSMNVTEPGSATAEVYVDSFEPGENRVVVELGREDGLIDDNTRYAVIDNTPPSPVLLLTAAPDSLAVRYLTAAVETGQRGYVVEPVTVNDLDPRILQRYPWLIIDDLGIVNDTLAPVLREYLDTGGAVFAALGNRSAALERLPVVNLPVRSPGFATETGVPHTVARIDSGHPALAETSGWRDINVNRLVNVETAAGTEALVSLDNGSPLVLESRIGQGRILILAGNLDNRQSDIPIRPVFVNFIAEAGKYLAGEQQLQQHQIAGDFLQLVQSGTGAGQVIDPRGRNLLSLAETHRSQDIKLNQTGFYEIYTVNGESLVAVNTDLRESELSPMTNEALTAWRESISAPALADARTGPVNIERESIELWHILLLLMGIAVLVESILGNRYLGSARGYIHGNNLSTT